MPRQPNSHLADICNNCTCCFLPGMESLMMLADSEPSRVVTSLAQLDIRAASRVGWAGRWQEVCLCLLHAPSVLDEAPATLGWGQGTSSQLGFLSILTWGFSWHTLSQLPVICLVSQIELKTPLPVGTFQSSETEQLTT